MSDFIKNKKDIFCITISFIIASSIMVKASSFEPGSKEDPVVTKSYVDKLILDNNVYLENKINEINTKVNDNKNIDEQINNSIKKDEEFNIVSVQKGKSIVFTQATQFILRGGKARIIDSVEGGILDITQGKDLRRDWQVPANHMLLVPRSDNRGAYCEEESIFIVIGSYEIK
ncbi:MAG: hypothetical protein N4A54_11600 [Peptostreptococcaceae bacterium]|nr:hypothetical protein [Peptostreptococcaceae bacterium]